MGRHGSTLLSDTVAAVTVTVYATLSVVAYDASTAVRLPAPEIVRS